jgi:hypothetical protein
VICYVIPKSPLCDVLFAMPSHPKAHYKLSPCSSLHTDSHAKYLREISYLFLSLKFCRRITSIDEIQSNTTINICMAKRCLYTASLNNDMFRPLYRPSSGCTFSYFKVNYTIYSVFVIEVSCTSIKSGFKNNYSNSGVKKVILR